MYVFKGRCGILYTSVQTFLNKGAPGAVVGKLLLSKAMIWETKCLEPIWTDYHCLSPLRASCVLRGVSRWWDEKNDSRFLLVSQPVNKTRPPYRTCMTKKFPSHFLIVQFSICHGITDSGSSFLFRGEKIKFFYQLRADTWLIALYLCTTGDMERQ